MKNSQDSWFNEARFGMFIHWGPYSVAGRGEWLANRENIPQAEYAEKYAAAFCAEKYDPAEWARIARDAGMKYAVLTTRHHDGFCLWDTRTTDFNSVKIGAHRDLVAEYVKAMRAAGLRVGFYFSMADWYHPDYPGAHRRDWSQSWPNDAARLRFAAYYHAQLEELMTNYGPIDLLWYDGCIPSPTEGEVINKRIKQLQPGILITNRNGEPWDVQCCEQAIRPAAPGVMWEACMTLNDNWGYHAGDDNWKSARHVARLLCETASQSGNLLLNVGPRGDGTIPSESVRILAEVGAWLRANGEFLPDSERCPYTWQHWGVTTVKGSRIYLHVFKSTGAELCFPDIKNRVLAACLLADGAPLSFEQRGDRLFLKNISPVTVAGAMPFSIVLDVDGTPETCNAQTSFWIPG